LLEDIDFLPPSFPPSLPPSFPPSCFALPLKLEGAVTVPLPPLAAEEGVI